MSFTKEDVLKAIGHTIQDAFATVIYEKINEEIDAALEFERKRQLRNAVAALYEIEVDDELIIKLLCDHWDVEPAVANEELRIEKTIRAPQKAFTKYLRGRGCSNETIRSIMTDYDIKGKLENSSSLWELSPEELVEHLHIKW